MQSVYLDLNLEEEHDHPDNRGWMNLFKHWSWATMLRATYAICCSTLSTFLHLVRKNSCIAILAACDRILARLPLLRGLADHRLFLLVRK